MKRALLAVVLLCVVVLASCVPSQEEPYKVLLILRSWSSEASVDITRGANAAARKCGIALTTKAVTEKDEAYQQAELLRALRAMGLTPSSSSRLTPGPWTMRFRMRGARGCL